MVGVAVMARSPGAYALPADREIVIVAYGDSLTAGFQLPQTQSFPAQLEKALKARGHKVRIINSGVSGDTAADGLARFDWAMQEPADAAILELGANDALRGLAVAETRKSLAANSRPLQGEAHGCPDRRHGSPAQLGR